MRQQINLYQDVLIERKPPLRAALCAVIVVACLVLLVVVSLLFNRQQQVREAQLAQKRQVRTQLETELQHLKTQNPPRQNDPRVAQELARLQAAQRGRQALIRYFNQSVPDRADGFYAVMQGLARYPFDGVWLTGISLNRNARHVQLSGSATQAERIPAYLKHLGEKQILKGQTFARLNLSRIEKNAQRVDFQLVSDYGEVQ